MSDDTLSAEQFALTARKLKRLDTVNIEVGRRVLVDGLTQTEAAKESGLTPQRVSAIVIRILRAAAEVPKGWERVVIWLPKDQAKIAREMERKAKNALAESFQD